MEMAPAEGRREGAAATVEMREGGGGVAGTGIERSTGEVECRVVTGDDLREEMGKPATSSCARWGGGGAAGVGEEAGRPAFRRRRAAGVGEESGRPNVGTNGRRWGGGGAAGGWDEAAWGRSGGGKGARCVSAREGSLGSGEKRFASGNLAVALAVNMVCRG